jgi:tRNA A37 N6-isopentenylltransferase MiaA
MINKTDAIVSLRPTAQWVFRGDDLEWLDAEQTQPTEAEIISEVERLQAAHDATEYQRKRAVEYPPMADYIDGVVKGDQAQIDAYIAACQAVKAKYPKPQ